ncbi:flagellar biosynthetic protein FliO [Brenneria goodwinii]|uniref:flagellar biosynthetic protein FliO n=1 Tax=Brenneria goodwinii TaxID=1109412 RepID=UPI00065E36EE|nr:flagellar biosynthetic protein FliO [Brenneria goodwinii]MCG8158128.1 flagellar biosynthetic protein FliO [Brenneria goodwinii]MCG8162469.1 flagellar biosynthetic protein FliO [Brenneria goodwinii]MCG8167179.1 flagellar biosynthetic protein FliO [Brenneria goodwinii]MCG8171839.1 flagellar biosynthetic protein FliO [Brenneria goodwinii]MCG8176529.1 flagellar biosynthetic protein FliO [Brenneria goodwinii]
MPTALPSSSQNTTSLVAVEPPLTNGALLTQIGSVLAGILLFILLIAWLMRKLGFAPTAKSNRLLKVVSACQVGQRERVVIVEVDENWLVLGVTAQNVNLLHQMPAQPQILAENSQNNTADFARLLQKVLKRPGKSE